MRFRIARFVGIVEKVEPEAVVQSSVTMFPVLVSLNNSDGALMPGMNGQVVMDIIRRDNVLAVPSDAIRNARDAATVAPVLGVSPDSLKAVLAAARQRRAGGGTRPRIYGIVVRRWTRQHRQAQIRRGELDTGVGRWRRDRVVDRPGGGFAAGRRRRCEAGGWLGAGGRWWRWWRGRYAVVFVKKGDKYSPRVVRVGVSDFDYTEILSGVNAGRAGGAARRGGAAGAARGQLQARIRAGAGGGLAAADDAGGRRRGGAAVAVDAAVAAAAARRWITGGSSMLLGETIGVALGALQGEQAALVPDDARCRHRRRRGDRGRRARTWRAGVRQCADLRARNDASHGSARDRSSRPGECRRAPTARR